MMGQAASIGLELAVERDWDIWLIHASSEFRCMVEVRAAPMGSIIVYMTIEKTTRLNVEYRSNSGLDRPTEKNDHDGLKTGDDLVNT